MLARIRRSRSPGSSSTTISSGVDRKSGCPLRTTTPLSAPAPRSTRAGERRVDLVEHLHDLDDVERIALLEVRALVDERRQVRRLCGRSTCRPSRRRSRRRCVAGGGTSTFRIASWCAGSSRRSGIVTLRSSLERAGRRSRPWRAISGSERRGSRGRADGRRARRARAPTAPASKPNAGARAAQRARRARPSVVPAGTRSRELGVEGERGVEQLAVVIPDAVRGGAARRRPGRAGGRSRRAPRPGCAARRRGRRATAKSRRCCESQAERKCGSSKSMRDRPLEQRLLELEHLRAWRRRASGARRRRGAPRDLLEGVVEVDRLRFLRELADQGQVRHDELGRRLGPRVAGQEPGEEAVVELEVGGEVDAAERGAAQDLGEPRPALVAVRAGGEQQRDVGVVGAGEAVAHEEAGVGVLDADALVVADLAVDRVRPRDDDAAGGRAERAVGGVQAHLDGRAVARHARRAAAGAPCAWRSAPSPRPASGRRRRRSGSSGLVKRSA